jgi:hypothetical protein
MNPHSYIHLIFDKGAEYIPWRKDSLFKKCCWEKWLSMCRKLKVDPCLSLCSSINSKWMKDLNTRPKPCSQYTKEQGFPGNNSYIQGLPE